MNTRTLRDLGAAALAMTFGCAAGTVGGVAGALWDCALFMALDAGGCPAGREHWIVPTMILGAVVGAGVVFVAAVLDYRESRALGGPKAEGTHAGLRS